MLIIREKPDYYDSAIGFGVDKTIVYNRKTQVVEDGPLRRDIIAALDKVEERNPCMPRNRYTEFHVGFCGRVYTGAFAYRHKSTGAYLSHLYRVDEADYERCHYWVEKDYPAKLLDEDVGRGIRYWGAGVRPSVKNLREWLDKVEQGVECLELFQTHRLVSFVAIDRKVFIEPCLKDLGFQKVVGGVEAYQEIMMFISGVLGMLGKETPVTEDKYIALSKGFDERSFRKDPTKRAK